MFNKGDKVRLKEDRVIALPDQVKESGEDWSICIKDMSAHLTSKWSVGTITYANHKEDIYVVEFFIDLDSETDFQFYSSIAFSVGVTESELQDA